MEEKQSERGPIGRDRASIERARACLRVIERIRSRAPDLFVDVIQEATPNEEPATDAAEDDDAWPIAA